LFITGCRTQVAGSARGLERRAVFASTRRALDHGSTSIRLHSTSVRANVCCRSRCTAVVCATATIGLFAAKPHACFYFGSGVACRIHIHRPRHIFTRGLHISRALVSTFETAYVTACAQEKKRSDNDIVNANFRHGVLCECVCSIHGDDRQVAHRYILLSESSICLDHVLGQQKWALSSGGIFLTTCLDGSQSL
jgi:hypothetical protein